MRLLRIKFLPGCQKKFIADVYQKSGLSTKQLAKIANIHSRSFIDWRREKLTMPLKAAQIFSELFDIQLPESTSIMVKRWIKSKNDASRKGGINRFIKYGSFATKEGCRKGGRKSLANLRRKGIIPTVKIYNLPSCYNEYLAEYIGIMLGDGGITSGQCTITLNSEADKDYIQYVSGLGKLLFGEEPKKFYYKTDKAVCLYYNRISLVQYLVSIGLKIGNKVKQQVGVPEWINSSQKFKIACLRGLMDTDGGVFLHRYTVNGKKYMYKKISFSNRSLPILQFVFNVLSELKFTPKIIDKIANKKVWLYNANEVEQYLKIVKTNNARLLKHNGEVA